MPNYRSDSATGSLTSKAVCSVSQVCEYLKVGTTASITGFLSNTINRVSEYFESYITLPIKEQSFVGYYDSNGCYELFLNNYPITSISSVKYRYTPYDVTYNYTIPTTELIRYDYKIVRYPSIFPWGLQAVEVCYNAGYTNIPKDLEQCAMEAVAMIYKESTQGQDLLGVTNQNETGTIGGSFSFNRVMQSKQIQEVLDGYRRQV